MVCIYMYYRAFRRIKRDQIRGDWSHLAGGHFEKARRSKEIRISISVDSKELLRDLSLEPQSRAS